MTLDSAHIRPPEVVAGSGDLQPPAKSLRHWFETKPCATAPQDSRCLLTLERYPRAAIRSTRLVSSDTSHQEARSILLRGPDQPLILHPLYPL